MIADERHGNTEPRSAIDYIPGFNGGRTNNGYSDRVQEADEQDEVTPTGRTLEEGNRNLNNELPGNVLGNQHPLVDNEWSRN
jgi:hypothetical protein